MLEHCAALHMAASRDWIARASTIAAEVGFGETYPFLSVEDIARRVRKRPVQFLFVHFAMDEGALRQTIHDIRHHHDHGVKFMPLIACVRESSAPVLQHFLKMGFDDIVAFPCTIDHLAGRLGHQLGRKLDYYQTEAYFGPDRRRLLEDAAGEDEQRQGGHATHIVIQRDPLHGNKVISQQAVPMRQVS